jgi:iron complex transport system substrate-binding protein
LLILLLLTTAVVLIACGTQDSRQIAPGSVPSGQTAESAPQSDPTIPDRSTDASIATLLANLPPAIPDRAPFPVTIENCGRTLTFAQPPQRVISLWQPPNELLLALGVQDQVIGFAGNYTALPASLSQAAAKIPALGSATHWPSREVMLTENPDLVISEGLEGFAFDPAQGYATVAELEQNGAQVFSTGSSCNPLESASRGIEVVYQDLQTLGRIFGVSDRAEQLIEKLRQRQQEILQRVKGREPVPTVFYNGGEGPLSVLTTGVWQDSIRKAGGKNVFDNEVFQVGVEEFANSKAEVILIGVYPGQDAAPLIAFLKQTFPDLPAVQADRLHPIPTIETEASIRIMDGLEKIARAIHPEAFE